MDGFWKYTYFYYLLIYLLLVRYHPHICTLGFVRNFLAVTSIPAMQSILLWELLPFLKVLRSLSCMFEGRDMFSLGM